MYIYILTDGTYHKIGISKHPEKRLKQLQTAVATKLRLVETFQVEDLKAKKLETQLHRMFWLDKVSRFKGEWFNLTQEHIKLIKYWLSPYVTGS